MPARQHRSPPRSSTNGQAWSAPVTVGQGGTGAAVALAANGRAVVVWVGGTATAPVIQASAQAPGGAWSAPVTVGGDARAPVIGIDGSGNAIIAWEGSTGTGATGPVYTASLPAGGTWTAVKTLTPVGGPVHMAVNSAGSVIIAWGEEASAAVADSGTVLGGFAAPVTVGPSTYGHKLGKPQVALNTAGQAVLAWATGGNNAIAATRSANGTWSIPAPLSCGYAFATAIDGAGDAIVLCEEGTINAVADAAGTFVVAYAYVTTDTVTVLTSPPGGGFGPAATFPDSIFEIDNLNIAPGRATLVWDTTSGAFESTEPVS